MDLFGLFHAKEFDEQRSFYRREKQFLEFIKTEPSTELMTEKERRVVEEAKARNWKVIQDRIAQEERENRYVFDIFLYWRFVGCAVGQWHLQRSAISMSG